MAVKLVEPLQERDLYSERSVPFALRPEKRPLKCALKEVLCRNW
jgi:hypothetical protein